MLLKHCQRRNHGGDVEGLVADLTEDCLNTSEVVLVSECPKIDFNQRYNQGLVSYLN